MKRIVYINKVNLDSTLPAVNFSLGNVYGLAEAGAEVTFFAQANYDFFDENELYRQFNLAALSNLSIRAWRKKRKWGIKTNQWFYREVIRQISEMLSKGKIDYLISRDPGALPYLYKLRKKYQLPVFYQPHNFYVDLKIRKDLNSSNAGKYHWLEKKYIPQMTGLLCLQESQARLYRQYYPDLPIYAAKPGLLSLCEKGEADHPQKYDIGYVGSLQEKKGIDILLEAFKNLNDPSLKLVLIGGRHENEINPVRNLVHEAGMEKQITVAGWMPYKDVLIKLKEVRVGILPLKDTFYNHFLTAPNKLFDYIGMGIPVIASDLPAIRDFITSDKEGILIPPENPAAMAQAILAMTKDADKYTIMSKNAYQLAKESLWKKRASEMIHMMESEKHHS